MDDEIIKQLNSKIEKLELICLSFQCEVFRLQSILDIQAKCFTQFVEQYKLNKSWQNEEETCTESVQQDEK